MATLTDISGWHGLDVSMLHELRGKNLACWCGPGHRCHADVLIELANREEEPWRSSST